MTAHPITIYAKLPGQWVTGEQFERNGYRWEITVVVSEGENYTTFKAQRVHPLDKTDST